MTSASPKPRPVAPYCCGWGVIYPSRERLCRSCMGLYKEWRLPPPHCAHGPAALASTTNPTDARAAEHCNIRYINAVGMLFKASAQGDEKRRAPHGVRLPVCVFIFNPYPYIFLIVSKPWGCSHTPEWDRRHYCLQRSRCTTFGACRPPNLGTSYIPCRYLRVPQATSSCRKS